MSAILARTDTLAGSVPADGPLPSESGAFSARVLPPQNLSEHARDMVSLAGRALVRNVFYEKDFLLHAAHHLRDAGRPQLVTIWRGDAKPTLVGVFPVVTPRFAFGAGKARGWLSCYMMDGAPLIDAACADEVLDAFLGWLGDGERPAAGMVFPSIDADGPFAVLLRGFAVRRGLAVAEFDERTRAVLRPRADKTTPAESNVKRIKEWRRQERRMMEEGAVALKPATTRAEARDAFEHFLALEARGWKGRAGTAMMQDPSAAAFARSAIRAMASDGRCRIDLLEFDGNAIAATIEFAAGDRAYFWKIAYDEERARSSPGVQLALKLTQRHLESRDASMVDSCAEADHPMIDRLWSDRMRVVDLFVAVSMEKERAARIAMMREAARRRARAYAKRLYRALRPAKGA